MKLRLRTKRKIVGLTFIAPWFLGVLLFFVSPIFQTLSFSFNTVTITPTGYETEWIGFTNYFNAFKLDADFPIVLVSSLVQLVSDVPFILAFSFFVAVILNHNFKGNHLVKLIFFLTVILSTGAFQQFQNQSASLQNSSLMNSLSESKNISGFLSDINIQKYIVEMGLPESWAAYLIEPMMRLFAILSNSGIQIFIFLAALKTISPSLYEASKIEGATAWESFWMITFPMVSPMIVINVVYTVIDSFFSPANQALRYVQNTIFRGIKFGYGSALAWIYFLLISVILAVVIFIISKRVFYYDK